MTPEPPRDRARFWTDPDLDGLECLHATYVEHRFATHAHEEFVIGVIQSGAQGVRYRGGNLVMPERTTCVMNPQEPHTGHAAMEQGWSYRVVYPHPRVLAAVASDLAGRLVDAPFFPDLVHHDPVVTRRLLALHAALDSGCSTPLARQGLLASALAALITRHGAPRAAVRRFAPHRHGVDRARQLLHACPERAVSLEELAAVAGLSPWHFARSFTAQVGMPPHVYQLGRRIGLAKRLLAAGEPIAQVAAVAGFADQSHLTNRFKSVVGITPGAFRQKSKNLQDRDPHPEAESP
ncbi:Multiple antibiotic resistance protein MarA [Fundidesulfovibrio magnetotacticus]|uniref:Multiple antibiotic resistance protein MarA n=1 Tax=Fundidesulfovibrio magnetotacticus TaxID=2730080 RepID=A0A6V8LK33_9BACT|nr:AraC family transcriptional regulator [Fundidesulfovibrio magnetotacticus]GFK93073.1 Multiple antibiotic resistance protein MarA [Fundidesulfovibrio magnetotacticus]